MKTLIALSAFAFALSTAPLSAPAHADWTPRLRCDGLVVDGDYSFDRGFSAYQLVIRDAGAVAQFERLTGRTLANAAGEIVVKMGQEGFGGRFDGSMRAPLGIFPVSPHGGVSKDVYDLLGQWQTGGHYQVVLTHVAYSPGSTYQSPQTLGEWIFNDCQSIR